MQVKKNENVRYYVEINGEEKVNKYSLFQRKNIRELGEAVNNTG